MKCHICKAEILWGEKRYDAFGRIMCSVECQIKQTNKINKKIKGVKNAEKRNERTNTGVKPRSRFT